MRLKSPPSKTNPSILAVILTLILSISSMQSTALADEPQVAAGTWHTVGLNSDGKVTAVGWNTWGQLNVSTWTDIVKVEAGWYHTVGLKSDGTVLAVGNNDFGQCNIVDWNLMLLSAIPWIPYLLFAG